MAHVKRAMNRDGKGRFNRNLGWTLNEAGKKTGMPAYEVRCGGPLFNADFGA